VLPAGRDILAISSTSASSVFDFITLGDSDSNSIPDWWQNLSSGLTLSDYQGFALKDAQISDPSDIAVGTADDDDDNDGLSNAQEAVVGTCSVADESGCTVPEDTDQDGLGDLFESGFEFEYSQALLSQLDKPSVKLSPISSDTDGDGICDALEVNVFKTNPAENDTAMIF